MVDYLEKTISSVVSQGYPNLEYIIIDGGSTDGSIDIIKKYEEHLTYWVSEPDEGMYEAIQKGLERCTGEVMGWINSDDLLHQNSLFTIAELFSENPECEWLEGANSVGDEQGRVVNVRRPHMTSRYQFLAKQYLDHDGGFVPYATIQQESTYWRRSLWEKAGSKIDTSYKYAGDFWLWMEFFKYSRLYVTPAPIGIFRRRSGQKSVDGRSQYIQEVERIVNDEIKNLSKDEKLRLKWFKRISGSATLRKVPALKRFYKNAIYTPEVFLKQ